MGYLKKIGDKKFRIVYNVQSLSGKRRQKTETLVGVTKRQAETTVAAREAAFYAVSTVTEATFK